MDITVQDVYNLSKWEIVDPTPLTETDYTSTPPVTKTIEVEGDDYATGSARVALQVAEQDAMDDSLVRALVDDTEHPLWAEFQRQEVDSEFPRLDPATGNFVCSLHYPVGSMPDSLTVSPITGAGKRRMHQMLGKSESHAENLIAQVSVSAGISKSTILALRIGDFNALLHAVNFLQRAPSGNATSEDGTLGYPIVED